MGRHSAPDDDSDDLPEGGGVLVDDEYAASAGAGRHSKPITGPGPTDINGPVAQAEPEAEASLFDMLSADEMPREDAPGSTAAPAVEAVDAAEGAAAPAPAKAGRRRSTRADFDLIKNHGDVRARCLAALVVPFVVCIAVLVAVGASGRAYLIWIAVSIFVAGVLVGVCLDAGHKRYPPAS